MKLWSKEAFVLGGIYGVLETPLSLSGLEIITDILFVLFICCIFLLCLNRTPKFLSALISDYPKTTYYLAAIGWVPYFLLVSTIAFLGSTYFIAYSEKFIAYFFYGLAYAGLGLAFISLTVAIIRKK